MKKRYLLLIQDHFFWSRIGINWFKLSLSESYLFRFKFVINRVPLFYFLKSLRICPECIFVLLFVLYRISAAQQSASTVFHMNYYRTYVLALMFFHELLMFYAPMTGFRFLKLNFFGKNRSQDPDPHLLKENITIRFPVRIKYDPQHTFKSNPIGTVLCTAVVQIYQYCWSERWIKGTVQRDGSGRNQAHSIDLY